MWIEWNKFAEKFNENPLNKMKEQNMFVYYVHNISI